MSKLKTPQSISKHNTKGNKRKLIGLAVIILIGVAAWAVYSNTVHDDRKVYAQVAGHTIYEQEVRDFIADNSNVSEREATEVLADKYLLEALAEEQGISVSQQDIKAEYGSDLTSDKVIGNNYGYQYEVNELYRAKLAAHNTGVYKGKLLVAHFSRYVAYDSPLLAEQQAEQPKIGDEAAIAEDKQYAEDLINRLQDQVESGKITFEEAVNIEKNDSLVGETAAYPTLSHSGPFDTSVESNGLINDRVQQKMNELSLGEMSEPFVVEVSSSVDNDSTAESYFLAVQVDERSGGSGNPDLVQYIEEAKQRLGYEIYV